MEQGNLLRAGTMSELCSPTGDWMFIDLGFSNASRSCGVLLDSAGSWTGEPESVTFSDCVGKVRTIAERPGPPLHLVLEAPLSFYFTEQGNPLGRSIERKGHRTRYWYVGLGCSVLVAAQFLLRDVAKFNLCREVRLFEGFVSFKAPGERSDHNRDVRGLRDAVARGQRAAFSHAEALPGNPEAEPSSILELVQGLQGLPPIIQAAPAP